ncbi:MAG: hypothetical protein FWE41_03930 [Coriobacteriia bacterium]|nr:hypothetical protein [Coriobacteriia bacterium]MCL2537849.1 hypothetical protein [Coriobacteriia bacterium]
MAKDISRRAFMKIGVALSVAFSGLLAACTGRESFSFRLDELDSLSGLTRDELNERLRELAENPDETLIVMGAMCYETMPVEPEYKHLACSTCNANAKIEDWRMESLERIEAVVNEIISEGFDVTLDVSISCERCTGTDSVRIRTIFGIKFKGDANYHLVETSNVSDYEVLLAFLQGEETYDAGGDWIYPLYLRQDVIEKMTGLKYG